MQGKRTWQLLQWSVLGVGLFGLSGCPSSQEALLAPAIETKAVPVVQAEVDPTARLELEPQPVSVEICGDLPGWERPDWAQQTAQLTSDPRYGEALNEEPLKSLFEKFWHESVITFTTHGLSARIEPIYLSGIWTAIEAMDACYAGDRPDAINQGELAEVWLIGHQLTDLVWTGEAYQMHVSSTGTGLQFVQFERLEQDESLPLVVITANGDQVTVASGDW